MKVLVGPARLDHHEWVRTWNWQYRLGTHSLNCQTTGDIPFCARLGSSQPSNLRLIESKPSKKTAVAGPPPMNQVSR
jgi:hypothetical protein